MIYSDVILSFYVNIPGGYRWINLSETETRINQKISEKIQASFKNMSDSFGTIEDNDNDYILYNISYLPEEKDEMGRYGLVFAVIATINIDSKFQKDINSEYIFDPTFVKSILDSRRELLSIYGDSVRFSRSSKFKLEEFFELTMKGSLLEKSNIYFLRRSISDQISTCSKIISTENENIIITSNANKDIEISGVPFYRNYSHIITATALLGMTLTVVALLFTSFHWDDNCVNVSKNSMNAIDKFNSEKLYPSSVTRVTSNAICFEDPFVKNVAKKQVATDIVERQPTLFEPMTSVNLRR
jgi:hypothetical protein